jgi:hypothetical protein
MKKDWVLSIAKIPFNESFTILVELLKVVIANTMKNEDVFYRGDLDTLIFEIFKKQSFNNEGIITKLEKQ